MAYMYRLSTTVEQQSIQYRLLGLHFYPRDLSSGK
jgi:hypothetical protein